MKLWYRWFDPVFPLAQLRDGDGWLCLRHVTTVRKTSQLFKFGKSQKTLFSFCFRYVMIKTQHTEWLERGRRVAQPPYFKTYFITYFKTFPNFPTPMYAFDGLLCFCGVRVGLDAIKTSLLDWLQIRRFPWWEIRNVLWFASNLGILGKILMCPFEFRLLKSIEVPFSGPSTIWHSSTDEVQRCVPNEGTEDLQTSSTCRGRESRSPGASSEKKCFRDSESLCFFPNTSNTNTSESLA